MPVKRIRGASRALEVLEAIAKDQPINLASLARDLGEDKSNLQRILMTLADSGWIRAAPGTPTRWELTARIYALADMGQGHTNLRHRARAALDRLRSETGESVLLAVPDRGRLISIDVLESTQIVRAAPYVGMVIPPRHSAAGLAVLAHLAPEAQSELLGQRPDEALERALIKVRRQGYSVSDGAVVPGSTNIGGAILDSSGHAVAAIVVSAPSERMPDNVRKRTGKLVQASLDQIKSSGPLG